MTHLWKKLVVSVDTNEPMWIDLLTHCLFENDAIGVEVDYANGYLENHPNLFGEMAQDIPLERLNHQTEIIAYFEKELDFKALESLLKKRGSHLSMSFHVSNQEDEKWQTNWMKNYQPQHISRFLTIVPVWQKDYPIRAEEKVIWLDPGIAFGTGNHPTTRLSAQALEVYMRGGESVYDVGTGSGILAFIARQLGASKIVGVDLDPQAVESAKSNLLLQEDQSHIHFQVNDLLKGFELPVDIIIANILPHILVHLLDDAQRLLKANGYLILGGILKEKLPDLLKEVVSRHWTVLQTNVMNEWTCLVLKKEDI